MITGALIGLMSQTFILARASRLNIYGLINFNNIYDQSIISTLKIAMPIFISVAVNDLNYFVDKYISSLYEVGSISIVNFSTRLYLFFVAMLIIPISTNSYPRIRKLFVDSKDVKGLNLVQKGLKFSCLIVLPVIIFVFNYSYETVDFIFNRGEFNASNVLVVAGLLKIYIISLIPVMIIEMSNKVLYSKQDSKTPLKVTLFTIGLNILISYFLSIVIGIKGIAYGTTTANLVGAFIMVYILRYEENIRILNNLKDL